MINMDSGRSAKISDKLSTLAIKYGSLKNDNDGYASYDVAVEARMKALQEMIDEEAAAWVPKRNKSIKYENARLTREGKAPRPFVTEDNFSIQNMSMDLLQYTYDTLNSIRHVIRESINMTGEEQRRTRIQVHKQLIQEINEVRKPHDSLLRLYADQAKSGYVMLKSFADYKKGSEWENRQNELNKGAIEKAALAQKFSKPFEDLLKDYKNLDKMYKTTVDIGLKDASGTPVLITHDMLVCVYLDLQNSHNVDHVVSGGYHIPDIKEYYKGFIKKSFEGGDIANGAGIYAIDISHRMREAERLMNEAIENGEDTPTYEKQIEALEKEAEQLKGKVEAYFSTIRDNVLKNMTEYDYAWANAWIEFNKMASEEINTTTMELLGFKKAVVERYFPIHSDRAFLDQKFDALERDLNLENMGSMKSRVHSSNAIYLEDISDVVTRQIDNVSRYCGLVIPLYNAKKIYGFNSHDTSVVEKLAKYDGKATKYIKHLFEDLQDARKTDHEWTDRILAYARHGVAGAALLHNLKIALKQGASYPTAAAEIGYIPIAKALFKMEREDGTRYIIGRAEKELIYKYTPLLAYRSLGYSTQEVGDLKSSKGIVDKVVNRSKYKAFSQTRINEMTGAKKRAATAINSIASLKWAFGWIQAIDTGTVGRLWYACKYYVDKQYKDLAKGSDEYYKQVAEVFNRVIENTQANYTVMQRPDILRSTNPVTKMFTMFKTQLMQNFNILYDAAVTYDKMRKDYNNGVNSKNGVTLQDKKTAGTRLARSVSSQIVATAAIIGLGFLADAILHRMNPWRDDDEDITWLSVTRRLQYYFNDSLMGTVMGGSELHNLLCSIILKEPWYGFSMNGLDTIDDLVNNLVKAVQSGDGKYIAKTITNLGQTVGAPLANIKKAIGAVALHIKDIKNGKFLSFESGVNRTYQQNLHRSWSAINLGNRSEASAIMDSLKEQIIQKYRDKGKKEADAKKKHTFFCVRRSGSNSVWIICKLEIGIITAKQQKEVRTRI